jgi:hypothetical protein
MSKVELKMLHGVLIIVDQNHNIDVFNAIVDGMDKSVFYPSETLWRMYSDMCHDLKRAKCSVKVFYEMCNAHSNLRRKRRGDTRGFFYISREDSSDKLPAD